VYLCGGYVDCVVGCFILGGSVVGDYCVFILVVLGVDYFGFV